MDQEEPYRVPPASSSSNPASKVPTSRPPSSTPIGPSTQLPRSRLPPSSPNVIASLSRPYTNPPTALQPVSSSSKDLSLNISSALTQLFSRAEDVHRQSTLFKALPPASGWKGAGILPTPAQLAYRDDIKRKSVESEKAMKMEVEHVVEKVRAALVAEVRVAAGNLGIRIAAPLPVESVEEARAEDTENAKQIVGVLERLSSLEKSLQEERQARRVEAKEARDQLSREQVNRMDLSTRVACLEAQKVVREREVENLRKEREERDVEMKNIAIDLKKKGVLLQNMLERLEKLKSAPIPPTLEGFVRQEDLDSTNKKQKISKKSLKKITRSNGEIEVRQEKIEKQITGMEAAISALSEDSKVLSQKCRDTVKHSDGLARTSETLPELGQSRDCSNGEQIAALVKEISTLMEFVDKQSDHLNSCLAGNEDSFLKTELSVIQTKIKHIDSLVTYTSANFSLLILTFSLFRRKFLVLLLPSTQRIYTYTSKTSTKLPQLLSPTLLF